METTNYLNKRVEEIGLKAVIKPIMNIFAIELKDPKNICMELSKLGWRTSLGVHPPCLRVVVMPYVTKQVVDEFIPVLEKVCKEGREI
jgi:tyrosine decarboxylase/tyrosine decarboxylase/aspartate 1-decarboxylase